MLFRSTLIAASDAWSDQAGGTSGIIWGILLKEIGKFFGNEQQPDVRAVEKAIREATSAVTSFGKAKLGDKTLADVLIPFSEKLSELVNTKTTQVSISEVWKEASLTAEDAAQATAELLPKIGRARPHAEKSLGHQDPGAKSLAIIINVVGEFLGEHEYE